jgi:hypothetical protein
MTSSHPRVTIVAASLDILGGQEVQVKTLREALARDGYRVGFIPVNPRFPPGARCGACRISGRQSTRRSTCPA